MFSWPNARRPGSTIAGVVVQLVLLEVVEAARRDLARRQLDRRRRVEAELLRLVEDRLRAELDPEVAEDGVDRVDVGLDQVDVAELLGAVLVERVVDLHAVLGAVAGVVEARGRRVLPGLERGGGGDRLERRARRVEPLGRAVEQRRRRARARARRVEDARVAGRRLDLVRVVARRRRHHVHLARLRVEHDRGAALSLQRRLGDPLRARPDVQHEVVPGHRRALQPVGELVEDRAEIGVRRGQVRVLLTLDPGARPALRRVADDLRGEAVRRVAAEVERAARALLPHVLGQQQLAAGRVDQPALDAELRDTLDRVVLLRRECRRLPRLPVGGRDDQRREQQEGDHRDA